jgi:hypothetical protein
MQKMKIGEWKNESKTKIACFITNNTWIFPEMNYKKRFLGVQKNNPFCMNFHIIIVQLQMLVSCKKMQSPVKMRGQRTLSVMNLTSVRPTK